MHPVWRDIIFYDLCGGVLITLLKLTEYRSLALEHCVEIYDGLIAALRDELRLVDRASVMLVFSPEGSPPRS
jgi:hypothetical protein